MSVSIHIIALFYSCSFLIAFIYFFPQSKKLEVNSSISHFWWKWCDLPKIVWIISDRVKILTEISKFPDFLNFHCIKQLTWTPDSLKQVSFGDLNWITGWLYISFKKSTTSGDINLGLLLSGILQDKSHLICIHPAQRQPDINPVHLPTPPCYVNDTTKKSELEN